MDSSPIVLCGFGRMGSRVLEYLLAAGMSVVVVDTVCKPDDPRLKGARLVIGDCRRLEILEQAGITNARGVLLLINDDRLNVTTALNIRGINRDVRIVLRMFNQNLLARLGKAVHNVFALSTSLLTAPILAMTALTGQALGTYRFDESADGLRQLVELTIGPTSPYRDKPIGNLIANRDLAVVAHITSSGDERVLLEVQPQTLLATGDRIVVHGAPRELGPLVTTESEPPELLWANWASRNYRMLRRSLAEMDRAVLICTSVLVTVVTISTLVLHFGVQRYRVADAFLRTVSVMATAASMHEEEYTDSPNIRVYVSILRIVGAVLMAAFTAIVTNYLLRARLGGALEIRRIPESGHVIVCGLGSVGFRVVEELIRLGEQVVAIDSDPTSRFLTTARRLGAAVVVGDATVLEVLRQANAASARGVISATHNDMTNLEMALLVRELNAEQRVVLLLEDPQFANMLREAAGVRLAFSVPALTAPAFLAGLFGDRVVSVFMVNEGLYAILDLVVGETDPFVGLPVRVIAFDYHVLPVSLSREKVPPVHPVLGARLQSGDRLLGIITLGDLERLLRRQPCSAGFAVDVTAYPVPARGWLAGLMRMTSQLSADEADRAVEHVPLRLATSLTRGQAEDLLVQLNRERVRARLCPADEPLPTETNEGPVQ